MRLAEPCSVGISNPGCRKSWEGESGKALSCLTNLPATDSAFSERLENIYLCLKQEGRERIPLLLPLVLKKA